MSRARVGALAVVLAALVAPLDAKVAPGEAPGPAAILDAWLDDTSERAASPKAIADRLKAAGVTEASLARLLRAGRATYPAAPADRGELRGPWPLACRHFEYDTSYLLFVPKAYDPAKAWPLVVVGHGGNNAMGQARAESVARQYADAFLPAARERDVILAVPVSGRGWDWIGSSVVFTLVSKLSRELRIDPDRVYVTGQSMGGHLAWRMGIFYGDRWGAVGPMSGGYDYVANRQVLSLFDVPGYATHGRDEPYGIADHNRKIAAWMKERAFPWTIVEKPEGHEIFPDEVPKVLDFFLAHPRELSREKTFVRATGALRIASSEPRNPRWETASAGRAGAPPILYESFGWVRVAPLPEGTPADEQEQTAWVVRTSRSSVTIVSRNVRSLRLYLADRVFDVARPLKVTVNGTTSTVTPKRDVATTLALVKEYDDRGRVFQAYVDLHVASDGDVPEPRGP